jgi:hypothetical protein
MIKESSIYQNVDTVYTIPIKKNICQWGVGFGFYGHPNPTCFDFFLFFRNSNLESLYNGLSKTTKFLDI